MTAIIDKIEKRYRIPCGPLDVAADGVCRRRLKDRYDDLLDRLTEELHPESQKPELPEGHEFDEDGKVISSEEKARREEAFKARDKAEAEVEKEVANFEKDINAILNEEDLEQKKQRLIEEGKMKAEVKAEIKKYQEQLMGNSKMLQDVSGKIKKR